MDEKKHSKVNKKLLLIIGGILLFLIPIAIFSWGLYHGQNLKKFANNAGKMMTSVNGWEKSLENEEELEATKNRLLIIQSDSDKYIKILTATKVSKEEKQLKDDLLEYFQLSKKVSTETLEIYDWSIEITDAITQASNISILTATSNDTIVSSIEAAKTNINASLLRLNKITPPESVKDYHNSFVSALRQLVVVYDKIIDAVRNNKVDVLTAISTEFSAIQGQMDNTPTPDIAINNKYEADIKRLNELETQIQSNVDKYKNTNFAF